MDKATILLLSGGLDSMVTGALAREAGFRLFALTIDYGQRHRVELEAAARVAEALGAERQVVRARDVSVFGGSALTNDIDVPKDGRADQGGSAIPVTYVPARNLVFLSVALAWAEVVGARHIHIGVNAIDYSGYPDCRPDFVRVFEATANLATRAGVEGQGFSVEAPLLHMSKGDIAAAAVRLGLDAGLSWSCYDPAPGGLHCGCCDSCRLRARAFADAGLADPTAYAVPPVQ